MEMHQIRYFLAICSERNFTRAAKLCQVSQPSLTRAIKLLEAEFGGLLFRREHPYSQLTELGGLIRPHLQQVWDQSAAAVTRAHEFTAVGHSRLRIGLMCTIAPALLTDLLTRMRNQHKAIEVEIVDGSALDLEEQLVGGDIAAAVYGRPDKTDPRVDRIPLFRERMMIAMRRDHRLAGRPSIRLADLAGVPQIRRSRCEYNELVERLFRQHRIDREIAFDSPRDDWTLALIVRGLGVALMPQHSIDHPAVVSRPLVEPTLWREASLFTYRERANGDGLEALVQEATRMTAALACIPAAGDSPAVDAR
ncbi:MAG TPA: LysR family transcriptional regulator [Bradyrhizobium sp.]|nr:LysR family transcriptional regulator [Bradyrhizobium sp.]